jgi:bifunctional UDP-N-acetylglucosamine pyrophosphorylase/glucosamine-1-phosphate N-acetyltransferase
LLVTYGDVPLTKESTLDALVNSGKESELSLLTAELDDPSGYGRIQRGLDSSVVGIVEEADATDDEKRITEINTGLMAGPAGKLREWIGRLDQANRQGEYYLTGIVEHAVGDGVNVIGYRIDDAEEAFGINDRLQLAIAERALQRRYAEALLNSGASIADPARIDVRGELIVGKDVFIDIDTLFIGKVVLGDSCRIGPHAVIKDSTIGAGTIVHPNSVIEASETGRNCEIGPFARLRPGTKLLDTVKIGNFVETKKSLIGNGSKVNHLSYVGDSTIGSNVNVGAGTITCNYDGANKHKTTIGDDVFIGSGVNLVAPIEIGRGATIGAGSTLTKNAPPDELSVARTRQVSVPGWKRPIKKASS